MRWPLSLQNLRTRLVPEREITLPVPKEGFRLWCHATTADQASGLIELVTRCTEEAPDIVPVITSGSPEASAALAMLPPDCAIQTFQINHANPGSAARISADLIIWSATSESAQPPAHSSIPGAKLILVDVKAAHSNRFGLLQWTQGQRTSLQNCDRLYACDADAVSWLATQGVAQRKISNHGPLCPGIAIPASDDEQLADYANLTSARPIWLCTNFGEADRDIILAAHRSVVRASHRLLLVISPANPESGSDIADWFDQAGLKTACRSRDEDPDSETQIFIADATEDVALWYRLAAISFVGGSFTSGAMDNPYWPAALGSVVVYGPMTGPYTNLFERLSQGDGAVALDAPEKLGDAVKHLLSPHNAAALAHNAWQITSAGAELIDSLTEEVLNTIDQPAGET